MSRATTTILNCMGLSEREVPPASLAARVGALAYGLVAYLIFLAAFAYAVGFVGGFITPTRLDGSAAGPLGAAVAINVALLTLFAVQHSVMARPWFKRRWTRLVPTPIERSTYVITSGLVMLPLFLGWRPMGGVLWDVQQPVARAAVWALFASGWLIVFVSTLLLNHFDLFGLRQVWLFFRGRPYTRLPFKTPGFYGHVRHPLYVGWMTCFWVTPTMTLAHLLFAVVTTAYMLVAIGWEERDLIEALPEYAAHRQRVPMLVPRLTRRSSIDER